MYVVVSEAFGAMEDLSAVSSYRVRPDGSLSPVTASLPTTETAACWIEFAGRDRYAYTTNAVSGTITGFRENPRSGELTILDPDGVTADTGPDSTPLDLAAAGHGGKYLYVLAAGSHEIAGFEVGNDGSLSPLNSVGGLPDTANGLVAW
jgi:6-phosphogluconolactonase (cycloisomerase 2 family)